MFWTTLHCVFSFNCHALKPWLILVRVSTRFEFAWVWVIGSQLYLKSEHGDSPITFSASECHKVCKRKWIMFTVGSVDRSIGRYSSHYGKQRSTYFFIKFTLNNHNAYQKCTKRSTYFCIWNVFLVYCNFSFTLNFWSKGDNENLQIN